MNKSYKNPYSVLLQKDYGSNYPQTPWLDRHGPKLGVAIMTLSALCTMGGCIILFFYRLP